MIITSYCLFSKYLLPFQLPNVESKIDEVTNLIENDIEIVVKRGKRSFDSIATEIQNKVQSSIPEIKAKILDVGESFSCLFLAFSCFLVFLLQEQSFSHTLLYLTYSWSDGF